MAVLAPAFDETQRRRWRRCATRTCRRWSPTRATPVEREFLARSAGDLQVPAQIEGMFADTLLPEEIAGVAGLLDAIAGQGFADAASSRRAPRWSTACATPTPRPSSV